MSGQEASTPARSVHYLCHMYRDCILSFSTIGRRCSPSTVISSGRESRIDSIEGYHRMLSPCSSRKNISLDEFGFVDKVGYKSVNGLTVSEPNIPVITPLLMSASMSCELCCDM